MPALLIVCRYVRVVGVYNSMNRSFHLVSFACLYTFKPFRLTNRDIIGKTTPSTTPHYLLKHVATVSGTIHAIKVEL